MSDLEEDAGALGRQKSIFSGMGRCARSVLMPSAPYRRLVADRATTHRVRQINQFREKWNTSKTKMHPPGAGFGDAAASSAWVRRGGPKKYSATLRSEGERDKGPADAHSSDRPRLHRALTASDLERYRSIALWLSGNGIDIVDAPQAQATAAVRAGGVDVFDDVLDSLDALEKSVESELALMSGGANNQSTTTGEVDPAALQVCKNSYCSWYTQRNTSHHFCPPRYVDRYAVRVRCGHGPTDLRLRRGCRAGHRRYSSQELLESPGKRVRSDGRVRVPSALPIQRREYRALLLSAGH